MRPLKLRLVAEMPTSPASSSPVPSPMHGPHPDGSGCAPGVEQRLPDAALLRFVLHRAAGRGEIELARPARPSCLRSTFAAASRSSSREFTHDTRYAFWIATFFFAISATDCITCTVSGPETCGVTSARFSTMRPAYIASSSGAGGFVRHSANLSSGMRAIPCVRRFAVARFKVTQRHLIHRETSPPARPIRWTCWRCSAAHPC